MVYNEDVLIIAYKLHQTLLIKGELRRKDDPDLFKFYFDSDVREVLQKVFLPIDKAKIFFVEDTLYFVPEVGNDAFSYTNEELRRLMKLKDNKELYLAQFIWMNLLSEFYGEQFLITGEVRSFIKVDEILLKVKEYIEKFEKIPEDELIELSTEYQLDILGLIKTWHQLPEVTDKIKDVSKAPGRDYGFFLKVLGFLEEEKLIVVKEKVEIVMTDKMKDIVGNYYHQETRINEIKQLLNQI